MADLDDLIEEDADWAMLDRMYPDGRPTRGIPVEQIAHELGMGHLLDEPVGEHAAEQIAELEEPAARDADGRPEGLAESTNCSDREPDLTGATVNARLRVTPITVEEFEREAFPLLPPDGES